MPTTATYRDLNLPAQRSFSGASGALLAAFGPSLYTAADQAANPDKPMTRLVKDVLRVGVWEPTDEATGKPVKWDVTLPQLQAIAQNNAAAKANGRTINLCMTHGGPNGVHPLDILAPIDQVVLLGETLWCSVYVTPEQARMLRNPAMHVSVREVDFFEDDGHRYGPILLHVAVVDLPVVTGQGPFRDLAVTGGSKMDLQKIIAAVNQILSALGMGPLPDGLDETTFLTSLETIAAMVGKEEASEGEATPTDPSLDPAAMDPSMMSKSLSKVLAAHPLILSLSKRVETAESELAKRKAEDASAAKVKFSAKLDALCTAGHIDAAKRTEIEKSGARLGYDMALLDGYETARMVNLSKTSKRFADPTDPAGKQTAGRTDEEYEADMKKKGLKPVKLEEV